MEKLKVSIKGGSYLPNIGGVSIHISRLAEALLSDKMLGTVYSSSKMNNYVESRFIVKDVSYSKLRYGIFQSILWFILYGIKDKSKIVHINAHPVWESPTLLFLLFTKKKIVFTIHDQMMLNDPTEYPKILLKLFKLLVNNKKIHWIAVNQTIKNQMMKLNPKCNNISVINAYIPARNDDTPLNHEIEIFIKSKTKIISIYAHSIRQYQDKDLYGIDLALKAVAIAKEYFPDIGLIIIVPIEIKKDQLIAFNKIIIESNIINNVLIYNSAVNNPINLWRRSDILLRPTLTDGDSLVVREALDQGTCVIASDIVNRPHGVILFKSEDVADLSIKIIQQLSNSTNNEKKVNNDCRNNYELIKEIYYSFSF
jgi:glycosyltransferase involved in cell wall biosynthesis